MHPIVLKLGPVTVYAYGVAMVAAFLLGTWLAVRAARALPPGQGAITPEPLVDFLSWSLLGGILGGRLFYIAIAWPYFRQAPWEWAALWHGGLVWYGGLFGGLAAGWLYTRARRLSLLRVMDQVIPFVALGHAIGRIGCFLNGCCYGKPTTGWCAVLLPGHPEPVIPTQLIESAGLVALFVLLRLLQAASPAAGGTSSVGRPAAADTSSPAGIAPARSPAGTGPARSRPTLLRYPGRLFGLYLVLYAALRFGVEFLRGDQPLWWGGLTLPQVVSLALVPVGLWLSRRRTA